MCLVFFALNANKKLGVFPLPGIADLLDYMGRAIYFSNIDLATGFYQVILTKADTHQNEFLTNKDLYEYIVIPFGVCNIPAAF